MFEPKSATLERNVNLILDMDPLVHVRLGDENLSSSVHMGGHLNPKWTDKLILFRENNENTFYIEVWCFSDFGSNDLVGLGYASIT